MAMRILKERSVTRSQVNDVLRSRDDGSVANSIHPCFFGIVLTLSTETIDIRVDVAWECLINKGKDAPHRVKFKAGATLSLEWNGERVKCDLEPLRAALRAETSREDLDPAEMPRWDISIKQNAHWRVSVELANASPASSDSFTSAPLFFNVRAQITFFPEPPVNWNCINCAVLKQSYNTVQLRLWNIQRQIDGGTAEQPAVALDQLDSNPVGFLEAVLQWMEKHNDLLEGETSSQFQESLAALRGAVKYASANANFCLALRLTAQTLAQAFQTEAPESRNHWRLFHLIYVLTHLPVLIGSDIANYALDEVPVVYFPTGRGKTEACLGAMVLQGFVERLQGSIGGVTVWVRFPTRLLSAELIQTTVNIISTAEAVRRRYPEIVGEATDPFAIGFIGLENDGPELGPIGQSSPARLRCPSCHTESLRGEFDPDRQCALIRCTRRECKLPGGLVPFISGKATVCRFLPSMIIGTVESLSGPMREEEIQSVLGLLPQRCLVHGYCGQYCPEPGCRATLQDITDQRISRPIVFIPDHHRIVPQRSRGTLAHGQSI